MTSDEFLAFYDSAPDNCRYELIRGEVVESPLPTRVQGVVAARVSAILCESARVVGYPVIGVGIVLGRNPDTVRVPPVAYFQGTPTFAELEDGFAEEIPFLVALIDTDESTVSDYLKAGVRTVWMLNSIQRTFAERGEPSPFGSNFSPADFFRLPHQTSPSP